MVFSIQRYKTSAVLPLQAFGLVALMPRDKDSFIKVVVCQNL